MTDEEEGFSAEVIPLRPGQDAEDDSRPLDSGERVPTPFCVHDLVSLDREAERVYCRHCGREVPAFKALLRFALDWESHILRRKETERRARVAQANLEELLRDERNAKSRQRTRRRKEPDGLRHLRAVMGILSRPPEGPGVLRAAYDYLRDLDGRED